MRGVSEGISSVGREATNLIPDGDDKQTKVSHGDLKHGRNLINGMIQFNMGLI